jgi:transcriptional repressor BetI
MATLAQIGGGDGRARRAVTEDARRRQLMDATIDAIAELGFPSATLSAIAARAGVSTGLVAFYFGDKDGLLEATLRHLAGQLRQSVVFHLSAAAGPRARIQAVIDANLGAGQFDRRIATVWLAFWAQVTVRPRFRRVQRVYERRMLSNLIHDFRAFVCAPEAAQLAEATAALIDGLWLRSTLASDAPDSAAARRTVSAFVDAQLALIDLALLRKPLP